MTASDRQGSPTAVAVAGTVVGPDVVPPRVNFSFHPLGRRRARTD